MEGPIIHHKWEKHYSSYSSVSSDLLETGELTDVTLAAGSKVFSVHKFVLSIASPFFRQLFRRLGSEKTVVFLKDVDPTVLEILIQFIYKGEAHIPQGDLTNLLETAKNLEVQGFNGIEKIKSKYGTKRQIESNANNSKVKVQKTGNHPYGNSDSPSVQVKEEIPEHLNIVTPDIAVDNEGFIKTEIDQADDPNASSTQPILSQNISTSSFPPPPLSFQHQHQHVRKSFPDPESYCSWCKDLFDKRANPIPCFGCNLWFHHKCRCRHNC